MPCQSFDGYSSKLPPMYTSTPSKGYGVALPPAKPFFGLPFPSTLIMRNTGWQGLSIFLMLFVTGNLLAQESRIAARIAERADRFAALPVSSLPEWLPGSDVRTEGLTLALEDASFYRVLPETLRRFREEKHAELRIALPVRERQDQVLRLMRATVVTPSFQVLTATGGDHAFPYQAGEAYWGVVEGDPGSLVALYLAGDELMGILRMNGRSYTFGKVEGRMDGLHVLYADEQLRHQPAVNCHVDDESMTIGSGEEEADLRQGPGNCVRMYIEVDNDIYNGKGGVQQAADYVLGAFSQVAILYANESIDFVINELLVWNVADPYTGPSTSNYLTQFRNYQNGNYNGDLAHLVGYNGGGGIAYLDVLCNSYYGVGYSAITASYQQVPTYSWTVMVLTHEIGHNLGSPHTHACAWNGNNTAIDGCGPQAGYSEGCTAPLPENGGTVMSYCHLIGGVGINLNNGFGPQPGDRIRNRVYNASCLSDCGPAILHDAGITTVVQPVGQTCEDQLQPLVELTNFGSETLTSVNIHYQVDNGLISSAGWNGSLAAGGTLEVPLPAIAYSAGWHTFRAWTSQPNGQSDQDPSNDESASAFEYVPGGCDCYPATGALDPNPLTHTGSNQSTASMTLPLGAKDVAFTIANLNAKLWGSYSSRFNDRVTVTFVDGNGAGQSYGTFLGNQASSVQISISGFVQSVTVALSNDLNNGYKGTLSVSFSPVSYCNTIEPCLDEDGDGVCDEDDLCPGFNNNWIGTPCDDGNYCTDNDVYTPQCTCEGEAKPGCEPCLNPLTSQFSPNPRTHKGSGSSSSTLVFPAGNNNVLFTVSNLNARTSGGTSKRFIDRVLVTWVNGNGITQTYGVFNGDQVSSFEVWIPGAVQSVTVSLSDGYDGYTSTTLSVSMSPVTSCGPDQEPLEGATPEMTQDILVYPNPASSDLFVRLGEGHQSARIRIYNALGVTMGDFQVGREALWQWVLPATGVSGQWIYVSVQKDGQSPVVFPVMVAGR